MAKKDKGRFRCRLPSLAVFALKDAEGLLDGPRTRRDPTLARSRCRPQLRLRRHRRPARD